MAGAVCEASGGHVTVDGMRVEWWKRYHDRVWGVLSWRRGVGLRAFRAVVDDFGDLRIVGRV